MNDPTINFYYMLVIYGILLSFRISREQFLNPIIIYYNFNVQISIYGRRVLRGSKNNINGAAAGAAITIVSLLRRGPGCACA